MHRFSNLCQDQRTYRDPDHFSKSKSYIKKFLNQNRRNDIQKRYWEYQNSELNDALRYQDKNGLLHET